MIDNQDIITDVDLTKRKEDAWCNIYHVKIVHGIVDTEPMDEFAFAYKLQNVEYMLMPSKNNDYTVAEDMEMRASKIYRDVFSHADRVEKEFLTKGKYYETKYIVDYKNKIV